MGIKRQLSLALLCVGLVSWNAPSLGQHRELSTVEIQTIPVAEGVYMLTGEGGNIGVAVGEGGVFLVDDQFAPLTDKIVRAIATLSDQPIQFLINTHWHFDHTGGNENLGKQGVVIVAHDQVRARMSTEQFIEAFQRKQPPSPDAALPVVTFNDTTTFHLNGQTIHAFHVGPAHTDGDSVIHFQEANVIHTGDIFFNGFYPFIDASSGGSIQGMIEAVDEILPLTNDQTKIIPGHGPLGDAADLKDYRQMLVTVRDRIQAALDANVSLETFLKSKPTTDLDGKWGNGFLKPQVFLTIVYRQMEATQKQAAPQPAN